MLDKSTGELYIESIPVKLGTRFTRRDLACTPVAARSQVVNEPYHSFSLGEQQIAGQPFFVVLYFYGQQLESIDLAHSAKEFGTSWDDWSEERELKRKQWHDDWLHGQTGYTSHLYGWGKSARIMTHGQAAVLLSLGIRGRGRRGLGRTPHSNVRHQTASKHTSQLELGSNRVARGWA